MKTNKLFKIVFLIGLLTFTASCNKDEIPKHENFFTVSSELKITMTQGYIIDYGVIDSAYRDTVYHMNADFIDDGISFDPLKHQFYGSGNRLHIEFNAPDDHHLKSGTYVFDDTSAPLPLTFSSGFIEENIDYATGTGHHHKILDGTVIIIYDGVTYDFAISCSLDTGSTFVGTFKGEMIYNDNTN